MKKLILLAACSLFIGSVLCDVKTWTKNTNFDDPNNWSGGGVICSNDRKRFPKDMVAAVFIQKNESLQELTFSDNMVFTVGEGVVLSFTSDMLDNSNVPASNPSSSSSSVSQGTETINQPTTPRPTCSSTGRVVEFTAKSSSWFDPASWSTPQNSANDSKRFLLDLESIPCSEDRVVFPSKDSFLVSTEKSSVKVASMLIHNQEYTSQSAFNTYWTGDVSRYEFVQRPASTPNILGVPCGDDRSCHCNDRYTAQMKSMVCKYRECDEAKTAKACAKPIRPNNGQCCRLCGGRIMMTVDIPLAHSYYNHLHRLVVDSLAPWDDVMYTIGPLDYKSMEIVLIDRNGTGDSASAAVCALRESLSTNETSLSLGLSNILFERSDGVNHCNKPLPPTPPTTLANRAPKENWDYIIMGVSLAFAVVCILVVCLGVFLYRRKYASNGKNEMELGAVGSARSSQGFDNPVYDTPLPFEDSFTVSYDASEDQVNGFENAMYTPGPDTGGSVHSEQKKAPLSDPYAPIVKKGKKKGASGKKQKEAKNVGFDNPVYSVGDQDKEGTGSMVSVPLDEDDDLPEYVEHDGTGFANPIATGLSEEMMAPPLPQKEPLKAVASKGFDNPLFTGAESSPDPQTEADVGEVTVHVSHPTKKKKKSGKSKEHKGKNGVAAKEQGFGNPLYEQPDPQPDFYQPETPGEDNSGPGNDE